MPPVVSKYPGAFTANDYAQIRGEIESTRRQRLMDALDYLDPERLQVNLEKLMTWKPYS